MSRKRPQCQKCGGPMAGHKRPNGFVICPVDRPFDAPETELETEYPPIFTSPHSPLRREVALPMLGSPKAGGVYHYRNPNWEEPESLPIQHLIARPARQSGTPDSYVSTEPADDLPRIKHEYDYAVRESDDVQMMTHPPFEATTPVASSSFTSSRIRRSFTSILNNTAPLLSLFSARREDVSKITQTARQNGLHTGVMRPPDKVIMKQESDCRFTSGSKDPIWVLVGTDAGAVEHILDLKEKDTLAKLAPAVTQTYDPTPSSPAVNGKPHQFSTLGLLTLVISLLFLAQILSIIGLSLL